MFVCLQESVAGAVGPTLPGGLVVRIRRSHRRGPGSIPGQGSFSSSSLHLHFPKPRSSPSLTFAQLRHTTPTATQVHPRLSTHAGRSARTPTPSGTRDPIHVFPLHALPVCMLPIPFPHYHSASASLLPHTNFAPLHCRLAAYPGNKTTHPPPSQEDLPHTRHGSQTLVHSCHSWSLNRTPSPHRLLFGLEQTL